MYEHISAKKPCNNRYLYILKKIFGIVFASGGTRNEDPKWIRITRVIAIYRNVPKQTLVVPTSKSEEKTFMQIEHYGQKKLRFHRTFLNSVQL
jgi:hypothetical protein